MPRRSSPPFQQGPDRQPRRDRRPHHAHLPRAGHRAVAVYSEADRDRAARALRRRGRTPSAPPPAPRATCDIDKIIDAARRRGAEAIHPGYGFLSENADFAQAVRRTPGSSSSARRPRPWTPWATSCAARRLMSAAGVPVVPGTDGAVSDADGGRGKAADEIGYPVMLKAAAGGGGKGMRVVRRRRRSSPAPATRTAARRGGAFGDDARLPGEVRRAAAPHRGPGPRRHRTATCVHLGERECSIQRRHQKVIEETPSPVVDAGDCARAMGEAAVQAAQAVGYAERRHGRVPRRRATAQLLLPGDEHAPAGGAPGHRAGHRHRPGRSAAARSPPASRCPSTPGRPRAAAATPSSAASTPRIPDATSCPHPGTIARLRVPAGARRAQRLGVYRGLRGPALLRPDARQARRVRRRPRRRHRAGMRRALGEYVVAGIQTNIPFHRWLLRAAGLRRGRATTRTSSTSASRPRRSSRPARARGGRAGAPCWRRSPPRPSR